MNGLIRKLEGPVYAVHAPGMIDPKTVSIAIQDGSPERRALDAWICGPLSKNVEKVLGFSSGTILPGKAAIRILKNPRTKANRGSGPSVSLRAISLFPVDSNCTIEIVDKDGQTSVNLAPGDLLCFRADDETFWSCPSGNTRIVEAAFGSNTRSERLAPTIKAIMLDVGGFF